MKNVSRGVLALWVTALAMLATAPTSRADLAPGEAQRLLAEGNESFERGLGIAEKDRESANANFRKAASTWTCVRELGGVHNAKLEFNIGNAWMLTGDAGRAIAAYRRAAALEPGNEVVREGLEAARRRAGVAAPSASVRTIGGRVVEFARGVQGIAPARVWMLAAGSLWLVGWCAIALRSMRGTPAMGRLAAVLWLLAAVLVATPMADAISERERSSAVVVAREVIARTGPSDGVYEPAFKEPLRAGLELRVRERRGEWLRVSMPDKKEAWVRQEQVEVL